MTYELGIDLGGTKVLSGVIDVDKGKILSQAKKRSHADHGPEDLIKRLVESARRALDESGVKEKDVARVGIGVAGQIDREKGVVIAAPNLAGMADVKLAKIVGDELGKPVSLYNDVEAAAAGEASHGAGKGHKDFVVVFVGTGIGGAVYQNGEPYSGATHTAGELGHMTIDMNGRICGCGQLGHLEAYASRTAIVRTILGAMESGRPSVLSKVAKEINPNEPGGSGIRSGALKDALDAGDELTKEMLMLGADYLGAGLASIVNFYNPPLLVLGGGLIGAVDAFFEAAATGTRNRSLKVPRGHIKIVKAALEDYSGIVGAAVLASKQGDS